jgi:hypothetical protein
MIVLNRSKAVAAASAAFVSYEAHWNMTARYTGAVA